MHTLSEKEANAAQRLIDAQSSGVSCEPVRDLIGATDQESAYRIQEFITGKRLADGQSIIGRKIGLTSRVVQTQLGVSTPDFGSLFADMSYSDGEPIPLDRFLQPRVEAEVAFVLGKDIDADVPQLSHVIAATDFVLPALEIVDSRVSNWDIAITDTIADNASSGAFVLGTTPTRLIDIDLPMVGMVLERDGDVLSAGAGAACLGSPVTAVLWLARVLAQHGNPLRSGDIVLSGALGPMVSVQSPGVYSARIAGMGAVSAVFTEGISA